MKIKIKVAEKGGAGSGNWGHAGRPGLVGGSAPRSGGVGVGPYGAMTGDVEVGRRGNPEAFFEFGWSDVIRTRLIDDDDRAQIKREIASDLSKRSGVPVDQIGDFLYQWAESSNDSDVAALSMQQAAAEEFGVSLSDWQKEGLTKAEGIPLMPRTDERALMRSMYEATQDWILPFSGGDADRTVTLYRGVSLPQRPGENGETVPYTGNAIESWSIFPDVAKEFSRSVGHPDVGVVVSANVPYKNIVSMARTGPGCMNEGEMLVLGTLPGSTVNVNSVFVPEEDYIPAW